jgi:ParB-like chromosome segregation protein Spo0J
MIFVDPRLLTPPHRVTRPEHVDELAESMAGGGWQGCPLVGYPCLGGFQLLTGTHRRAAALRVGILVPLIVRGTKEVREAWGDVERWRKLILPDQGGERS